MASLGHTAASVRSRQQQPLESIPLSERSSSLYAAPLSDASSSDVVRGKAGKLTNPAATTTTGLGLGIGAQPGSVGSATSISRAEYRIVALITLVAFFVRFHKIAQPSSVVFDEVHFGGFASKYINGRFFMDVHPPLAKLLITFAAWLGGFDGSFDFKDIGKEYLVGDHRPVPYVAMRSLNALLGVATVPIAYLTLRGLSLRASTALLGAFLVLFDNALTTQSRLILLDSVLVFFTALTVLFWVTFCNEEKRAPFSNRWWLLLSLTGLSLGAVASSKWVGLFTIGTIGISVIAQLWEHLGDTRQPVRTVVRHFCARAICLIVLPILVYLFTFSIHLTLLWRSGEGDGFMSSAFQHTLHGHGMRDTYADVALGSTVTIRHLNTQGGYLHSHTAVYPGGSGQQQITLYPHRDENNEWIIVKAPGPEDPAPSVDDKGHPVRPDDEVSRHYKEPIRFLEHGMEIRLLHRVTDKRLHSHDTNRPPITESDFQNEVTGYGFAGFGGDANDNFHVEIYEGEKSDRASSSRVRSLRTQFRLRHTLTGCYLFSHKVPLPEWGFGQQEVTCNKNPTMPNSLWYVETNTHPLLDASDKKMDKVNYLRPSFLSRFWELQKVMLETNNGLTERHVYDSRPSSWPLLRRGINFWTKDHRQIYLIGNPLVWWGSTLAVLAYLGARALLMLRAKRGFRDFNDSKIKFYDQTCGFLTLGWALHFLPFFTMQRQLFLHHYLPALYFGIMVLAALFDFSTATLRPRFRLVAVVGVMVLVVATFARFAPLTYAGEWTGSACEHARWVKGWDFNCRDFPDKLSRYADYPPAIHVSSLPAAGNTTNTMGAPEPGRHAFDMAPVKAVESQVLSKFGQLASEVRHLVGADGSAPVMDAEQMEKVLLEGTAGAVSSETSASPATQPSNAAQPDKHADEEAHEAADVVRADRDDVRDDV